MNFIMIGLLLREELKRLRVRLNMYLVCCNFFENEPSPNFYHKLPIMYIVYGLGGFRVRQQLGYSVVSDRGEPELLENRG